MEAIKSVFTDNVVFAFLAVIAVVLFWVLVYLAKDELSGKWSGFFAVLWIGLLAIFLGLELNIYIFIIISIVLDIVLVLAVFGGDLKY
jgi:hypothetical protein